MALGATERRVRVTIPLTMNIATISYSATDSGHAVEVVWLKTSEGLYYLDYSRLVALSHSRLANPPAPITRIPFRPFEAYLSMTGQERLDLDELKYSVDGDSYIMFKGGAVLAFVFVLERQDQMDNTVGVLRFYPPGELDNDLAAYIHAMKKGTVVS